MWRQNQKNRNNKTSNKTIAQYVLFFSLAQFCTWKFFQYEHKKTHEFFCQIFRKNGLERKLKTTSLLLHVLKEKLCSVSNKPTQVCKNDVFLWFAKFLIFSAWFCTLSFSYTGNQSFSSCTHDSMWFFHELKPLSSCNWRSVCFEATAFILCKTLKVLKVCNMGFF